MILFFWLTALGATWLAMLVRLGTGSAGWMVPSVALCAVLIAARRSQPGRYRTTALLCGLCAGLSLQGLFLAPAIVLLGIGAIAHVTRRFLATEGPIGMLAIGLCYAILEALLLALFPGGRSPFMLSGGEFFGAAGGLILTAVLFAGCDVFVRRWRPLRHALERP